MISKDACIDQVHLKDLSNTVAVIDTYCWLHRALCGASYAVYQGKPVTAHIDFCLRKIEELQKYNIRPIFVFDGRNLPAKAEVDEQRKANRQKAKDEIDKLIAKGDSKTAYKFMSRIIDVSQEMARQLIDKLIEMNIDYIVAPYEADVQISYLVCNGFAHFAISEDSDLILYGCKYVFYKLSNENTGVLYRNDKVLESLGDDAEKFDFVRFRRMCILSGCDYLSNLSGVGLKKSQKFFSKITNNNNIEKDLEKIPTILNMKKLTVPKEYIKKFIEAENVFNHQLVYCPKEKKLRPFTDYNENHVKEKLKYAGEYCDSDLALNSALGNVDFKTLEIFDNTFKDKMNEKYFSSSDSIWNANYSLSEPGRLDSIVNEKLKPCYEAPEELKSNGKRKYTEEKSKSSNKLASKDKKAKTQKITTSERLSTLTVEDEEEDEVVVESSFISTVTTNNKSMKEETNTSINVEVKSRFFSGSQNESKVSNTDESEPVSELDRILKKRQEIRDRLKNLYPKSSSQASTDSGFISSDSQQSGFRSVSSQPDSQNSQ